MKLFLITYLALIANKNVQADVSHLPNNQYLPPNQQTISSTDNTGLVSYQPKALQQKASKDVIFGDIEISRSIPIASFSITNTVPVQRSYTSRNAAAPVYAPIHRQKFVAPVLAAALSPKAALNPAYATVAQHTRYTADMIYTPTQSQVQNASGSYNYPVPKSSFQRTQSQTAYPSSVGSNNYNFPISATDPSYYANAQQSKYAQQTYSASENQQITPIQQSVACAPAPAPVEVSASTAPSLSYGAPAQQRYSTPDQTFSAPSQSTILQQASFIPTIPSNEYLPPPASSVQQLTHSASAAGSYTEQLGKDNISVKQSNSAAAQQNYASTPQVSNAYPPPVAQVQSTAQKTQEPESNQSSSTNHIQPHIQPSTNYNQKESATSQSPPITEPSSQQQFYIEPQSNQISGSTSYVHPTPSQKTYTDPNTAQEEHSVPTQTQQSYSVPAQHSYTPTITAPEPTSVDGRKYFHAVSVGQQSVAVIGSTPVTAQQLSTSFSHKYLPPTSVEQVFPSPKVAVNQQPYSAAQVAQAFLPPLQVKQTYSAPIQAQVDQQSSLALLSAIYPAQGPASRTAPVPAYAPHTAADPASLATPISAQFNRKYLPPPSSPSYSAPSPLSYTVPTPAFTSHFYSAPNTQSSSISQEYFPPATTPQRYSTTATESGPAQVSVTAHSSQNSSSGPPRLSQTAVQISSGYHYINSLQNQQTQSAIIPHSSTFTSTSQVNNQNTGTIYGSNGGYVY